MDDETFPNLTIIMGVLKCLDSMNINQDNIEGSQIYETLTVYASEESRAPSDARKMAASIKSKWDQLSGMTVYEEDGEHNEGFKRMQRKLDSFKRNHVLDEPNENEEVKAQPQKNSQQIINERLVPISQRGQIQRTREGVMLPERNAFEFTITPERR